MQIPRERTWAFLKHRGAPLAALLCITVLGAVLRAYHLGFRPLWFDEAVVFWLAQGNVAEITAQNALANSSPPLFPILVSIASRASVTETSLRVIPWLAGTLAVPAMYLLARRFLSAGASLIAAFMVSIAPSQIEYSQQLREYSLSVLLAIVLLLGVSCFLERPTWKRACVLAVAIMIALFMQYGLALIVLGLNVLFVAGGLARKRLADRDLLVKWATVQALGLVAALAVYLLALQTQMQPGGFASDGHLSSAYWTGTSVKSAALFVYSGARDLIAFSFPGYVFTLLLYAGSLVLVVDHRRSLLPLFIGVPIAIVVAAALLRLYPLIGGRQDLFLTPFVFLTAATAFDYLIHIDKRLLLVGLLAALLAWRSIPSLRTYYGADGEGAIGKLVARVAATAEPGDPVYVCRGDDPVLRYYLRVRYPMPDNPLVMEVRGPGPRDYLDQVDSMLARYRRAWILTHAGCGDVTPLVEHISRSWSIELTEKRYPEAQLFFVQ